MSFKRVADDFDDFNLQRKRRVNDLLLEDVSADEVHLMANGKLACTVCHHRPVFDTMAMLTIHRNGKKHIANALVKLERAKEDAEIKQKREHEHYLKKISESNVVQAPLLGITNMHKEQALNSSHCLSSTFQNSSNRDCSAVGPCNNSKTSNPILFGHSTQGHSKDRFFSPKLSFSKSSCQNNTASVSGVSTQQQNHGPNSQTFQTKIPSSLQLSGSTETKYVAPNTSEYCQKGNTKVSNQRPAIFGKTNNEYNYLGVKQKSMKDRFLSVNPLTQQKAQPEANITDDNVDVASKPVEQGPQRELTEYEKLDHQSKAVYICKLRQLGWLMGLDGTWQKDENAEFDSDEDEPPSPRTVLYNS